MNLQAALFLPAALGAPDLLSIVLGREVRLGDLSDVCLPDFRSGAGALLEACAGDSVRGVVLHATNEIDLDRVGYFLSVMVGETLRLVGLLDETHVTVFTAAPGAGSHATAQGPANSTEAEAAILREAAIEIMDFYPTRPAAALRFHAAQIRARARARIAALSHAPRFLRTGSGALQTHALRRPYLGFFAVEERDFTFPTFSGGTSEPVSRAGFVVPDAATILPYDPAHDLVLLIEQCRFGPILRGDPLPWQLEAIAGHVNEGETPAQTVVREAMEEANIEIQSLEKIGGYYSTPGALSEYITSFVGLADLATYAEGIHGLDEETEDIRAFVIPFSKLEEALAIGEIDNGPLLISTLWLAGNRKRLRQSSAGA